MRRLHFFQLLFILFGFVLLSSSLSEAKLTLRGPFDALTLRAPLNYFDFNNSICNITTCTDHEDCPQFSIFYRTECTDGMCTYEPEFTHSMCNTTEQCIDPSNYDCECNWGISNGCDCFEYPYSCIDGCVNGTCAPTNGFLGEPCNEEYQCTWAGSCVDNVCQFLPAGAICNEDLSNPCQQPNTSCSTSYSPPYDSVCVEVPPCNENEWNGSCPIGQTCFNGTCTSLFQSQQGQSCDYYYECGVGLNCIDGTCERVPLYTPCQDDEDCEYGSQFCACNETSKTLQCLETYYYPCVKLAQAYTTCMHLYCPYEDIQYPGTSECYKTNCWQINLQLICCSVCNYPEYFNNAVINYAGSCAEGTFGPVDCCNTTEPCSVITTDEMCAGYPI